ncbi:MAG: 2OG-Fe(II) oxygenase [Sphingomonas sp.]
MDLPALPLPGVLPYAVRRDVLPPDEHRVLVEWALANEAGFVPSGVGRGSEVVPDYRNSLTFRGEVAMERRQVLLARIEALLPGLLPELGLGPFVVSQIEINLIVYNHGAYYRAHIDTFTGTPTMQGSKAGPSDRVVSAVYYFHAEPLGFSGGALRLHPLGRPAGDDAAHVDIEPVQNGLVAFSSWTPHEVLPIDCPSRAFRDSRFAVNCWFRRARGPGPGSGR